MLHPWQGDAFPLISRCNSGPVPMSHRCSKSRFIALFEIRTCPLPLPLGEVSGRDGEGKWHYRHPLKFRDYECIIKYVRRERSCAVPPYALSSPIRISIYRTDRRHGRGQGFSLSNHWLNRKRRGREILLPNWSLENAGILCVFQVFRTEKLGQKIRPRPKLI